MKQKLLWIMLLLVSRSALAQLAFSPLPNMTYARGAITSATDNSFFYVANGFSTTSAYTAEVERFDIANNTWTILTDKSIPKRYASSAVIDGNLYLFNGYDRSGVRNDKMEIINLNTGAIRLSALNPLPVSAGGAAVWRGQLYVFGGSTGHTERPFSDKLFRFDPTTEAWTELASMPEAKETKGAVIDGSLYVFGGFNGSQSRRIDRYDIEKNVWTYLGDMPDVVSAHAVTASDSRIYMVGSYEELTRVAYYDVNTNSFKRLQSNMTGRRHLGSHIVNGKLYVLGGNQATPISSSLSSVEVASCIVSEQSLAVAAVVDKTEADAPFELHATASSGLPVTLTVVSGPASLTANTLHIKGAGEVKLKASQPGNTDWEPAPELSYSFCIRPAKPVISVAGNVLKSSSMNGNQWYLNGEAVSDAGSEIFTANESGFYTVKVIVNGCASEMSEASMVSVTGIENNKLSSSLRAYPNPASSQLTVQSDKLGSGALTIRLINVTGSTVLREELMAGTPFRTLLEVGHLPKGAYVLLLTSPKGVASKRIWLN